jgi:hypothetical protein
MTDVYYYTQHHIMDIFEKLFIHHRKCQVVICKRCQFAVNPASVKGHIQRKHKTVTREQCMRVITFIGSLSQVAWNSERLKYPDASSPAIPGISYRFIRTGYEAHSSPRPRMQLHMSRAERHPGILQKTRIREPTSKGPTVKRYRPQSNVGREPSMSIVFLYRQMAKDISHPSGTTHKCVIGVDS